VTAARSAGAAAALAALAAAFGALLAVAAARAGVASFLVPLALVAAVMLLLHPRATLVLVVAAVVLLEADSEGFLSFTVAAYDSLPLQVHEILLGAAVAGVLVDRARSPRPLRTPGPFTLPLLLVGAALVAGAATGLAGGADRLDLVNGARDLIVLAILPFVAVNVIEDRRDLHAALSIAVVLVAAKVAIGAVGWVLGQGRPIEGTVLTYYEPLPNLVLLAFVLTMLAAALDRVRLRTLVWLLAPAALAVLVLSFRRNFWIALVVGAVIVLLVAAGARGRALLIPAAAALGIALFVGFTALSSSQSASPVIQRAQSLAPSRLQAQSDDRYRLDEQRNVRAELAEHPITGLGLGVPWAARHPLAEYFEGGRDYTHVTVLWWWLKLGVLGLVAYLWLVATAIHSGVALWRRAGDKRLRCVGLGAAAAVLGLAVAETTGSFTGVESRVSVFLGALFGWLAAALALRDDDPARV
jgi:O-antigen ligase